MGYLQENALDAAAGKITDKLFTRGIIFKRRRDTVDRHEVFPQFGYQGQRANRLMREYLKSEYGVSVSKREVNECIKLAVRPDPNIRSGRPHHWGQTINRSTAEWAVIRPAMTELMERNGIDAYQALTD